MFQNIYFSYTIFTQIIYGGLAYNLNNDNTVTSIPDDIPNHPTVNLNSNAIKQINSTELQTLTSLYTLYVGNNDINYISPQAFSNNLNLRNLQLYGNELENITFGTALPLLKSVSLSANSLNKMPQFCCIFPLLADLNLYDNDLEDIDSQVNEVLLKLPALLKLNLGQNGFTTMPNISSAILEELHMNYNDITSIDKNYFSGRMPQLKRLYLTSNDLTYFGPQESGLQFLEYLDVGYNDLTEFDSGRLGMQNLQHLKIQSNELASLPNITSNHLGLLTLDFGYNDFNVIPDEYLAPFSNLEYLDMSSLQLTQIPDLSHLSK